VQPSEALYKKPILRGTFRPATKLSLDHLQIERDEVAETLKITACHLSCAMQADVDAVSLRHGLSAPIRWFAHMPVTGARGVNFYIEAHPHGLGAECGLPRGASGRYCQDRRTARPVFGAHLAILRYL
jgi:hypothetical protein